LLSWGICLDGKSQVRWNILLDVIYCGVYHSSVVSGSYHHAESAWKEKISILARIREKLQQRTINPDKHLQYAPQMEVRRVFNRIWTK